MVGIAIHHQHYYYPATTHAWSPLRHRQQPPSLSLRSQVTRDLVVVDAVVVGSAHALCGRAAIHVVHHGTTAVVHGLLADGHLADLLSDLVAFGHSTLLELALSGM